MLTRPQALTTTYDGITRILQNKIHVSVAFDPSTHSKPINPQNCGAKEFLAIWDTGATGTAVNQSVIDECGLKQIGVVEVHTANEKRNSPVYLASIFLPNHVFIPFLRVHEATIKGADVLLGMDIITRGDFAVTNKDGKTVFSFRVPSTECIDFVKQSQGITQPTSEIPKVSRNAPCPCGSGKKYKKCHGR